MMRSALFILTLLFTGASHAALIPPIVVEVAANVHEVYQVIGRADIDHPWSTPADPTIAFDWGEIDYGHLQSTQFSNYKSMGRGRFSTLSENAQIRFELQHNYFIPPFTGIDISHAAKFWVHGPPGTPIHIERSGGAGLANYVQPAVVTYQVNASLAPPGFPASYAAYAPADLFGAYVLAGSFDGWTGPTTKTFGGEVYSLAYAFSEVINIWQNIGWSNVDIRALAALESFNQVKIRGGQSPIPRVQPPMIAAAALSQPDLAASAPALLPFAVGHVYEFTSLSYDLDNGVEPGDGIWGDMWMLRDPSGNELEQIGSTASFSFTEPGAYTLTLTTFDDEGDSASTTLELSVVPEPSTITLAAVAFSLLMVFGLSLGGGFRKTLSRLRRRRRAGHWCYLTTLR